MRLARARETTVKDQEIKNIMTAGTIPHHQENAMQKTTYAITIQHTEYMLTYTNSITLCLCLLYKCLLHKIYHLKS